MRPVTDQSLITEVLAGKADALAELERLLSREASRVAVSHRLAVDELRQAVRERLLVGDPPRLAQYDGTGPLAAWLRAVASRVASNLARATAKEELVSAVPEASLAAPTAELALLRGQYRAHFREAFAGALAALEASERTVLRLHTLDGLSLASIGAMFHRDASSVSRWLAKIRAQLLAETRRRLGARLSLQGSELESLMRVADSELTMSLSGLL
jgi:RNA polymerase sigma-70 factor (ECF subfamily)